MSRKYTKIKMFETKIIAMREAENTERNCGSSWIGENTNQKLDQPAQQRAAAKRSGNPSKEEGPASKKCRTNKSGRNHQGTGIRDQTIKNGKRAAARFSAIRRKEVGSNG